MTSIYDPAVLLDPSCFSFLHSPNDSMSDSRTSRNATPTHKGRPTNAYLFNLPRLISMNPSNQEAIMFAATGPAAAPTPSFLPLSTVLRMQSGQIPGSIHSSSQLAQAIAAELKGNVTEASLPFIERLFPTKHAPFEINKKIFAQLAHRGLFDRRKNSFILPSDFKESTSSQWFNNIGQAMAEASGIPLKRRWWYGTSSLPPDGSDYAYRPDLVLLDQPYYDALSTIPSSSKPRVNWLLVRSFAEVTNEKSTPQRMRPTINAKSYVMSTYQFDRRFVLALSLVGTSKFSLTLTDREGQIRFQGAALSDSNRENASIFLRILSFLMFGEPSHIGLDPAFVSDPATGQLTGVMVDDRCFKLSERIYTLDNMLGRSTKVWIVTSDNQRFVMKDSWVQATGGPSEVEHLKAMLGHEEIKRFVPTIVCGGDVTIDGEKDCTDAYRTHVLGGVHGRRMHRRIVTTPIGEAITNFRSKKELISALIDVVRVHDFLTNKLQILHRDISIGNIMLSRQEDDENASGLLIDFDYSEKLGSNLAAEAEDVSNNWTNLADDSVDQSNSVAVPELDEDEDDDIGVHERMWTGTPPFMAIEALVNVGKAFKQSACHDLESLLYVILYLCTYTSGPSLKRKDFPPAMSIPLARWFKKDYIKEIGRTKVGHMTMASDAIIAKFDDYWSDFVPFVEDLIKTCFPTNPSMPNQLTHEKMLAILEKALATVCDDIGDRAESTSLHSLRSRVDSGKRPLEGSSGVIRAAKKGKCAGRNLKP